jgi:hypothetical protein
MRIPIIGGAYQALVDYEAGALMPRRFKPTPNLTTKEWIEDMNEQGIRVEHIAKELHETLGLNAAELFQLHGQTGWQLLVAVREG